VQKDITQQGVICEYVSVPPVVSLANWGAFRSDDIGNYFAYYGKATDCFLIIVNDGSKYVIGCRDVENTVNYVNSKIKS